MLANHYTIDKTLVILLLKFRSLSNFWNAIVHIFIILFTTAASSAAGGKKSMRKCLQTIWLSRISVHHHFNFSKKILPKSRSVQFLCDSICSLSITPTITPPHPSSPACLAVCLSVTIRSYQPPTHVTMWELLFFSSQTWVQDASFLSNKFENFICFYRGRFYYYCRQHRTPTSKDTRGHVACRWIRRAKNVLEKYIFYKLQVTLQGERKSKLNFLKLDYYSNRDYEWVCKKCFFATKLNQKNSFAEGLLTPSLSPSLLRQISLGCSKV